MKEVWKNHFKKFLQNGSITQQPCNHSQLVLYDFNVNNKFHLNILQIHRYNGEIWDTG